MTENTFEFLPRLPKSNLDDRTYDDLIKECLLRIPRYCPEWTHHNPSDPGVTLIELFAWLTDQMLLRFNQVPQRNYITFLEILGIKLQPPQPAITTVTFYLSTASSDIPADNRILNKGIEIATERTDKQSAIIFATNNDIIIGEPKIRHLLTANLKENRPTQLQDRLTVSWRKEANGEWQGNQLSIFEDQPQYDNCFYIVFEPDDPIAGNVLELLVKGESATSTGILPESPPRIWSAYTHQGWKNVLLQEKDDRTEGFSFSQFTRDGGNPENEGVEIRLHTPLDWVVETFETYRGYWLRCCYQQPEGRQKGYSRSPRIVALSARSIGGSVEVTQCARVEEEILGKSDGTPGQSFFLQRTPILPCTPDEHIIVVPAGASQELAQTWKEVENFADSGPDDLHYTLDAITGQIQFGPLIREPAQLKESSLYRSRLQGESTNLITNDTLRPQSMNRQYGAVPPREAMIIMRSYRTGGGEEGNVEKGTIRIVKTAVPYVTKVINYEPARHGTSQEDLASAVLRVPRFLRTRERAVTKEDFESLSIEAGEGQIKRACCLTPNETKVPGLVKLLLVPHHPTPLEDENYDGLRPDKLILDQATIKRVKAYLDERRLLGIDVHCEKPNYVGVSVQTKVVINPVYNNPIAVQQLKRKLLNALYRFLNPLIGGLDGQGWKFGRALYTSDIVKLLQKFKDIQYIGEISLVKVQWLETGEEKRISEPRSIIQIEPYDLICSWYSSKENIGHTVDILTTDQAD